MYFILIGPFCFGLFVFHSALGANILFGTKYFCLYIRSGTVRLQEPALFPKHVIVIAVRDRSAPEPVLFRNELFSVYGPGPFGSESQVLFKNKHWCMWSETVWLWDPVLCLKRIFCWFVSGSRFFLFFWSEILLYAVLARSAPGPCIGHICGPEPFRPRSRLNICQRLLLYGLTAHLDLAYGRFRIFLQSISLVYTRIVTLWQ